MSLPLALLLSSALAGLAIWKKALTAAGTVLAWGMCLAICFFGGLPAFLILAVTFLGTVAADKLAGKRADPNVLRRKSGRRDAVRVLCNVGVGTAMILLYGLSVLRGNPIRKFLLAYAVVMAESLSDSLASKIGPLSHGKTIDICTFRQTPVGLSGGVSFAGSIAAMIGAAAIGMISLMFPGMGWRDAGIIALIGFAGCLLDSVLGSVAQVKYRCPVCGTVTERDHHCGVSALHFKGVTAINNDVVNLLSNTFSALVAIAVL